MCKVMTDQELDLLFQQSAQHHKAVKQINRQVMKTVRRDSRLNVARKWAKIIGICFGLPLLFVVLVYVLMTYLPEHSMPIYITTLALPIATLVLFFGKGLHDFSLSEL